MSRLFDCADAPSLLAGMRLARTALGRGDLVVIPTDTVYGIAANAFSPEAVARLRTAKGRGRELPPPVLIANRDMLSAIAEDVPPLV
ncbi:MAG TPA: Sua5/YciO/YrdC/YwlC family protein, partial [Microbacteriaceae bacterium]|nr:Sua5/YciO/YrdC/YwlC family protein [Microbacteriaceae bacterium]